MHELGRQAVNVSKQRRGILLERVRLARQETTDQYAGGMHSRSHPWPREQIFDATRVPDDKRRISVARMRRMDLLTRCAKVHYVFQNREMRGTTVELFLTSVRLGSVVPYW